MNLTTRSLTTHLINTLSTLPSPSSIPTPTSTTTTNPLQLLRTSPSVRSTFFTLHVLFPTSLLPALDLLDRRLVHVLTLPASHATSATATGDDVGGDRPAKKRMYLVLSTLSHQIPIGTRPRRYRRAHGATSSSLAHDDEDDTAMAAVEDGDEDGAELGGGRGEGEGMGADALSYHRVRTDVWSCTCPGFAFELFPAAGGGKGREEQGGGGDGTRDREGAAATMGDMGDGEEGPCRRRGGAEEGWWAGGMLRGEGVPMCKHLMACLLAERVGNLFGGFGREREVTLEEWVAWDAGYGG